MLRVISSKIPGIAPMNLKTWWFWLKSTSFSLKWYCVIILLKPILDAFYFVKDAGVFSPSQIVGLLIFIFSLFYILFKKQRVGFKISDFFMLGFGFLLFLNAILVYLIDFSIGGLGDFVRIIIPIFIFFYLKNEIKSLDDVNGFLMTFLISSIFPLSIYLYEFFFAPIRIEEISIGRGGGLRLTGIYADIFNYIAYIIGNFIIFALYFTNDSFVRIKPNFYRIIFALMLTFIGLIGIKHQASWGVFVTVFLLFLLFNIGNKYGKSLIFMVGLSLLVSSSYIWDNVISPLYSKEINAYEGTSEEGRALNGRIVRWQKYFTIWNRMPSQAKIFGVGFSHEKERAIMMSGGMHSDFIRFLFSTGILGLLLYTLFYIAVLISSFKFPIPIRFFVISSCIVLLLYAISSNPFGSSGTLLYLALLGLTLISKPLSFFVAKK